MIRIIDLNYNANNECSSPISIIQEHSASLGYVNYIKNYAEVEVIKHINYTGTIVQDGIKYSFFKKSRRSWQIPFRTLAYIKKRKPDVVLVQGFIFPIQVIFLRITISRQCIVLIQHHGEQPRKGIYSFIQRTGARCADGYLFTSIGNAEEWIQKKIISSNKRCFEILEASTNMNRKNKLESIKRTGISGEWNFLWVGRLNENKDPLTVLTAFDEYLNFNSKARLYMIYQEATLIKEVKNLLSKNSLLKSNVTLLGKVLHDELCYYYSAADFYISGSRKEGSGYALIEAMACGCIPVVTAIPSYKKIIADGKYGFLYEAGNSKILITELQNLNTTDKKMLSENIIRYFNQELSFSAIAEQLYKTCTFLAHEKVK